MRVIGGAAPSGRSRSTLLGAKRRWISRRMVSALCDRARFLAVNTQLNSGNRGFHAIHRYPRANFVSLNEPELRLAAHNRTDSVAC